MNLSPEADLSEERETPPPLLSYYVTGGFDGPRWFFGGHNCRLARIAPLSLSLSFLRRSPFDVSLGNY